MEKPGYELFDAHHPLSPLTTTLNYGVIQDNGDVAVRVIYDHRVIAQRPLRGVEIECLSSARPASKIARGKVIQQLRLLSQARSLSLSVAG